jgi:hypothetical protein
MTTFSAPPEPNAFNPIGRAPDGGIYFPAGSALIRFDLTSHTYASTNEPAGLAPLGGGEFAPDGNLWMLGGVHRVVVYVLTQLKVTPASLAMNVGSRASIVATYTGRSQLKASSNDPLVATVGRAGPNRFIVRGVAAGMTTVVVYDLIGNAFHVSVTVK